MLATAGLAVFLLFADEPAAQNISGSCDAGAAEFNRFLHCAATAAASSATNPGAFTTEPLHGYLKKLESMPGYVGDPADVDLLKRVSLDLKKNPDKNREAIGEIDGAVASHAAELRQALSREGAARGIDDGFDVYPKFVEQRLKFFLDPTKIRFYERGPFEIAVLSSLANTLEASYFLGAGNSGNHDNRLLLQESRILEQLNASLRAASVDYTRQRFLLNGNLFWQASILFALGDKDRFAKTLRQLIDENPDFDLESKKSSHVYIYKVFDLPFSILVQSADIDGKPILVTDDPHILNRYFNPGQLALTVCSLIGLAGQNGIPAYSDAIRDLPFYDFYVIVASGSNPDGLQKFGQALMKSIALDDHAPRLNLLRQDFAMKDSQVSSQMHDGAVACGIGDETLTRIYKPFDFKFEVRHIEAAGKQPNQLMLGGSLNAIQANKLAEFFNDVVSADSELRDQAGKLGVKPGSFAARARIE